MNSRWELARRLLVENETIVSLNLPELAGGDPDLLKRLELLCLCPLLCDSELETLLIEYPRGVPDMIAHRQPAPTPVGVSIWVLSGRVLLSLDFAGLDR